LQRLEVSEREDPFAAIVRCTADPAKADNRTRSKWSRVMRYAAVYKPDREALDQFVRRKGGINESAAGFLGVWGEGLSVETGRQVKDTLRRLRHQMGGAAALGAAGWLHQPRLYFWRGARPCFSRHFGPGPRM
jgi:hypothetical protein